MTTPDCVPFRDEILHHFGDGTALRPEAHKHYAGCVHCMTAVTAALSGKVAGTLLNGANTDSVQGSAERKPAEPCEEARRALAHGSAVLERAFGIRSGSNSDKPG
jgi:hypothetical protein